MKAQLKIIVLSLVLILVIAGGIFLLKPQDRRQSLTEETHPAPVSAPTELAAPETVFQYRVALETAEEDVVIFDMNNEELLSIHGQPCRLTAVEAGDTYQVVLSSIRDGEALEVYPQSGFIQIPKRMCLGADGTLWYVFYDGALGCFSLAKYGDPSGVPLSVPDLDHVVGNIQDLRVWDGYAALRYPRETGEEWVTELSVFESTTGKLLRSMDPSATDVDTDHCLLDPLGNLYARKITEDGAPDSWARMDLATGNTLWTMTYKGKVISQLSASEDGNLYALAFNPASGTDYDIYSIDPDTGALGAQEIDLDAEVNNWAELLPHARGDRFAFLLNKCENLTFSYPDYSDSDPASFPYIRGTLMLEWTETTVDPAQQITLTITAPYPVESIQGAVKQYQRSHPEVSVRWDTDYLSYEEFRSNVMNYKDSITVRTMAGDVGDLQMIVGSGMSQDVLTDTDAFTDLTEYLENSPCREDLPDAMLDPLRDKTGAVRGLALGVVPSYLVYNQTLLEELDVALDPETVTWSQLLDIALDWKREGKDLSLDVTYREHTRAEQDNLLIDLLLANLYDARKTDGTAALDTVEFRQLLEKMKELWDSPQLVRAASDRYTGDDGLSEALFTVVTRGEGFPARLENPLNAQNAQQIAVRIAPKPAGETSAKRQGYGFCWGIPASSRQKDAAWDLLEFLISKDGLPGYSYSDDTDPLSNAAMAKRYQVYATVNRTEADEIFRQIMDLRETPVSRYDEPYGWSDAVYKPIHKYMEGSTTLEEAITEASANWERFLLG